MKKDRLLIVSIMLLIIFLIVRYPMAIFFYQTDYEEIFGLLFILFSFILLIKNIKIKHHKSLRMVPLVLIILVSVLTLSREIENPSYRGVCAEPQVNCGCSDLCFFYNIFNFRGITPILSIYVIGEIITLKAKRVKTKKIGKNNV